MEREAYTSELLDYLWHLSETDGLSLETVIKNASLAQVESTSNGLILTGVSSNSSTSTFSFLKTITPGQVIELIYALKRLYKLAVERLKSELNEGETPTDSSIYEWMSEYVGNMFVEGMVIDYSGRVL